MSPVAQADLRRVSRSYLKLTEARKDFVAAVRVARASGESMQDIGRAAGLTRQRIAQILKERN